MAVRSKFVTQTGVGASDTIRILDTSDIRVAYEVIVSGTVTYSVQHTIGGSVYRDNTDTAAQTTSQEGNYVMPIKGVRINVTAGSGTATLHVNQLVVV